MPWVNQDTHGPAPLPAHGHTATLLGATHERSKLVVFGGQGEDNAVLGETHVLELGTWTWSHVQANGPDVTALGPCHAVFPKAVYEYRTGAYTRRRHAGPGDARVGDTPRSGAPRPARRSRSDLRSHRGRSG